MPLGLSPARYHFIPNTHLDREWTMDFQHTRNLTVDFLERLLTIFDRIPEYCFLLDAQAVPLEDYLEVMPERRQRISELVQAGRINAGPWYSALDMNCIGGESIVRNLLWGHLTVEPFGPVMKIGYTPFGWGQISQLPQIYRGFGIDFVYFYRGITPTQVPQAEFEWEGADGSAVGGSRFGTGARYNFYFDVWRKALYHGSQHRISRRLHWLEDSSPFKLCDETSRFEHGTVFPEARAIDSAEAGRAFRDLADREAEHFAFGEVALMHGMDTSSPDLREDDILRECRKHLNPGEQLLYSSLPKYTDALTERMRGQKLQRIKGEVRHLKMNEFGFSYIANDIISARTRQKALTARVENLLIHQAEPAAAMAMLAGKAWPERLLSMAWKQWLKCHPHDTIGGCGTDRIEQDAGYRLRDVASMANLAREESLMWLQGNIDTSSLGSDGVILTVFNPTLQPRSEVVEAFVDIPRELAGTSALSVTDAAGAPVESASQITGLQNKVFRDRTDLALMSYTDEHELWFRATDIPALGYRTFVVRRNPAAVPQEAAPETFVLENEFLRAEIQPDATVDLTDKISGVTLKGLNYFEDGGEVGHAWTHLSPLQDKQIVSRGKPASRTWHYRSPLASAIRTHSVLMVPATTPLSRDRKDWRQSSRMETDLRPMPIHVTYSLATGERSLRVHVEVENACRNHRLRAMFPADIATADSYAEAPFDVVTRRIVRDESNPYRDFPDLTFPLVRFAGITAPSGNLAIIGNDLKEYEVLEKETRTFALTIFRAYENNLCTSGDFDLEHRPGDLAQSQGKHAFDYRIFPGSPGAAYENVYAEANRMQVPLIVAETKARPGTMPMQTSFLELQSDALQFSGIKKESRGPGLVLRLFNPTNSPTEGTLVFASPVAAATMATLNEEPAPGRCIVAGSRVTFTAAPKQIVTLLVTMQ